jgi:hypothetical protein
MIVQGRGFLNLQEPPTVWIGKKAALNVQIVSNTEIKCSVPQGLGRNLPVKVTPSAKLYPSKPIMPQQTRGLSVEVGQDRSAYLEIGGETTVLWSEFSYDGEHGSATKFECPFLSILS